MQAIRVGRRGKGRPRTRPGAALGDKAYSSAANRTYLRKRGIKAVIPVKGGHHRLHTLVEGYVYAPVELRRQVRVTDDATGEVGWEDGPDPIWVTRSTPYGDGSTKGATAQVRLVYA